MLVDCKDVVWSELGAIELRYKMKLNLSYLAKAAVFIGIAVLPCMALGQSKAKPKPKPKTQPQSFSLSKITFTGLKEFEMARAIETSGLRKGQKAAIQDVEAAAKMLLQTGFFGSVGYQYADKKRGMELEFQVEEAKGFLPCVFDNFVWFSNEELVKTIRAKVPLFKGSVPQLGTAKQDVTKALQDLLRARKIPGTVRLLLNADLKQGKLTSCLIRVTDINLPIRQLQFRGAGCISETVLQEKAKFLTGQQYSKKNITEFVSETLVPLFKKKGYFRVQFRDPAVEIQSSSASEFGINVILDVIEGEGYRWDKAVWIGDLPLAPEELDRIIGMKSGDIADSIRIDEGISSISRELQRRGYLEARTKETPEFNDAAGTIKYNIQLFAGPKYTMGSLTFKGVPDKIANKLRSKWKTHPGENFDALYPEEFVERDAKDIIVSNRLASLSRMAVPDRERLTVNVTLEFQQLPRK
jgi:outer membrane protein assembly factor BamA